MLEDLQLEASDPNLVIPPSAYAERVADILDSQRNINYHDVFISKLKNRARTNSNCFCCNLWIAAHCWILVEFFGVFGEIFLLLAVASSTEHVFLSLIFGVIRMSWAMVALYGLRTCQPECIGGFIAVMLTMAIQTVLFVITDAVIDGPGVLRGVTASATILYNVWMVIVMYRVYKIARKCKYEVDPFHPAPKLSPMVI